MEALRRVVARCVESLITSMLVSVMFVTDPEFIHSLAPRLTGHAIVAPIVIGCPKKSFISIPSAPFGAKSKQTGGLVGCLGGNCQGTFPLGGLLITLAERRANAAVDP